MKPGQWRQRALYGTLALTIVLSVASSQDQKPDRGPGLRPAILAVAVQPRRNEPRVEPTTVPRIELERLQRHDDGDAKAGDVFNAMSWYVPPPPPKPVPPALPPPPSAPPMPFVFMGRYVEDGALTIMLVKGDRLYTVAIGDVIEHDYRVDGLKDGVLELTYLPMNIKQTLRTEQTG